MAKNFITGFIPFKKDINLMQITSVSAFYKINNTQSSGFDAKLYCAQNTNFNSLFSTNKPIIPADNNADYLSEEEFKKFLKQIDKRIKIDSRLSDNNDVKYIRNKLNRFNAVVFEKYLDKNLYNNSNSEGDKIKSIIADIDNPDDARKFNKIISNKNLVKSSYLMSIFKISQYDKKSEKNGPYKHLLNTLLENENLYKNECIIKNLDTIVQLAQSPKDKKLVYNVFLNDDFSKKYLKGDYKFTVSEDYIKNQHNLKIAKDGGIFQIITFSLKNDDKYDVLSDEFICFRKGINDDLSVKKDKDGNTYISVVRYDTYYGGFFPTSVPITQKNTKYDKNGNRVYTEIKRSNSKNPDLYTYIIAKPGEKPVFAYDTKSSDIFNLSFSKDFKSSEGVLTKSSYESDVFSNKTNFSYKITDSANKELLKIERTFEKIDDNHYISTLNGKKYEIVYSNDEVIVKSSDKDNNERIDKINIKERFDSNLEDLYKQLPGDILLQFKNTGTKVEFDNFHKDNAGNYDHNINRIVLSGGYDKVSYVLMHEAGHAFDFKIKKISSDEKLRKIFDKELLNYKDNSTILEGESINYFTTLEHQNDNNCLTEVVAETNAIISGFYNNAEDDVKLREIVLEQHFPKTIAYIANKLIENN